MNNTRTNSGSFDIALDGELITITTVTLTITDNTTAAQTNGVPDGTLNGAVSASGSITFDSKYFKVIKEKARQCGSFRSIPPVDLMFYSNTGSEEEKIDVFGCKLSVADLLNIDKKSDDATTHTVNFVVTSPDFIRIDGIPYLSADDTRHLLNS